MPEFKLEPIKKDPHRQNLNQRIFYTKGTYNKVVKISDWERYLESHPHDNDPYCPGNLNYFLAHYNQLGHQDNPDRFKSVTQLMLEQITRKHEWEYIKKHKPFINFYTYKDTCQNENDTDENESSFPNVCLTDYTTTMQDSYGPPHPYVMQRFALPMIPHLKYRKFKPEEPFMSPHTFFDEDYKDKTSLLQEHKRRLWISFNPLTGKYSDGSSADDPKRVCYNLDY